MKALSEAQGLVWAFYFGEHFTLSGERSFANELGLFQFLNKVPSASTRNQWHWNTFNSGGAESQPPYPCLTPSPPQSWDQEQGHVSPRRGTQTRARGARLGAGTGTGEEPWSWQPRPRVWGRERSSV
ncbi:hypothetical protein KIL84_019210 [Mauremys mutica]|uniref:Uncharacterized protein n=1 Tax=Mauremys mutica TaxID=74926 RepID=A0A9D3XUJ5_9SAUR|nr:hypothetical protein KIL84_019210 [Mauremys mutica]